MSEVKTIKNVDEETWAEFKGLAARHKVKLGTFLKTIVKEHEKSSAFFWDKVLLGEKILSDKEAEELERFFRQVRKEHGFRR